MMIGFAFSLGIFDVDVVVLLGFDNVVVVLLGYHCIGRGI
jgi:hypothetical protein